MPCIDIIAALLQIVRFSIVYSAKDSDYANASVSREGNMMISAGLFGLFALSAGTGFAATSECRAVKAAEPTTPRTRRPPAPAKVTPLPVQEKREGEPARPATGPLAQPDAGAPAPAVVVPD